MTQQRRGQHVSFDLFPVATTQTPPQQQPRRKNSREVIWALKKERMERPRLVPTNQQSILLESKFIYKWRWLTLLWQLLTCTSETDSSSYTEWQCQSTRQLVMNTGADYWFITFPTYKVCSSSNTFSAVLMIPLYTLSRLSCLSSILNSSLTSFSPTLSPSDHELFSSIWQGFQRTSSISWQ